MNQKRASVLPGERRSAHRLSIKRYLSPVLRMFFFTTPFLLLLATSCARGGGLPVINKNTAKKSNVLYPEDLAIYDTKKKAIVKLGVSRDQILDNYGSDLAYDFSENAGTKGVRHLKIYYENGRGIYIDLGVNIFAKRYRTYRNVRLGDSYAKVSRLYPENPYFSQKGESITYIFSEEDGVSLTMEEVSQIKEKDSLKVLHFIFSAKRGVEYIVISTLEGLAHITGQNVF